MPMTVLAVAIFVVAYALIATERVDRVAAALGGVAAMVLFGIVDAETAFYSDETGVDWNVIFLLLGMMIIVSVFKQTGFFEYLAIWAAQRSGGRPFRLMALLVVITAVASAVLDNVTTVLLVAPVTFAVCARLGLPVVPYLIAQVFASNIGGTATLIGDPPNIIIASRAGLSFNDFLIHLAPIVVVMVAAFLVVCRFMFRDAFRTVPDAAQIADLRPTEAITDRRLLVRCLVVLGLVIIGFVLHTVLHLEPSIVALLGAGAIVLVSRTKASEFLEEVEWPTLVFFMGLFVLVGGLVQVGVIGAIGEAAAAAVGDRYFLTATSLIFGSAVLGAFVDNIPYTAAMAPIVENLVAVAPDPAQGQALWWAFALGADLGGNTTAVAAGANVVVIGIAARHRQPIGFWEFTKYGLSVTIMTLVLAWAYVWLRYFAFV
jgi:Na+/H+ antiporter NhaD/arsenite permease-like protein